MAKETKEDLKLLSSLEDILSKKVSERLKGAKEANALRSELLGTLRTEKDLTEGMLSQFETYKELVTDVLETSDKSKQVLESEIGAISKVVELEKQRKIGQAAISDALNTQVDSLTSMVGNIPFIGSALKDAIDVDSLKDTVSGISESFTQGFSAAGMESGSLVDKMKGGFSAVTGNIGELSNGISFASIKQAIFNVIASINPYVLIIAAVVALIALVGKLISMGLKFNEQTTKIAKDLGVSVDEARDMEQSFNNISGSSKNLNVNTKSLLEAQKQLSDSTGLTAEFSEQMLTDQIQLTKFMGLSGDEAANFQKIATGNNQTAREMQGEIAGSVEQFNNATGASVSLKDVVQDIAKLPTEIRVGFMGTTAELAKTVAMAKVMGTTLEESSNAAEKTLSIESSLKAEAKARMLTGVSINNNAIRLAQLNGDGAKVLAEQKKQIESIAGFDKMNLTQKRAIADAMGMTVEQLVNQKDAMELQKKTNVDLSAATLEELKNAKGLSKEEKDKLIRNKEQVSAQEKLSGMSEKFGDLMNSIVAGPLGEMVGLVVDGLVPAFGVVQAILSPIFSIIGFIFKMTMGLWKIIFKIGGYLFSIFAPVFDSISAAVAGLKKPFVDLFSSFNSGEGSKFMDMLKETGRFLLDYVFTPIKMIMGFISEAIAGIGQAMATYITDNIQSVMDIFTGIGKIIDGDIMGGLKMIGTSIADVLISPFKLVGNILISVMNGIIGGINAISFEIPSWVPKIGGSSFSPNIAEIPQLAEGGIVQSPTIAEVGEAGPEAVVPLDTFFSKVGDMVNPSEFMSNIPNPLDVVGGALDGIGNLFGGESSSTGIDYDKLAAAISAQPIMITVDGKVVSEITRVQNKQSSFRK